MRNQNLVSLQLTPDEVTQINQALQTIQEILKPHLITISTEDRVNLPKMNEKTVPFVKKVLDYAESHPEFAPSYVNIAELRIDIQAFELLTRIIRPLDEINSGVTDTSIVVGSEAYIAALAYYNNVKQATKLDVPGAKVIFEDLRSRFENCGPRAKVES